MSQLLIIASKRERDLAEEIQTEFPAPSELLLRPEARELRERFERANREGGALVLELRRAEELLLVCSRGFLRRAREFFREGELPLSYALNSDQVLLEAEESGLCGGLRLEYPSRPAFLSEFLRFLAGFRRKQRLFSVKIFLLNLSIFLILFLIYFFFGSNANSGLLPASTRSTCLPAAKTQTRD